MLALHVCGFCIGCEVRPTEAHREQTVEQIVDVPVPRIVKDEYLELVLLVKFHLIRTLGV